jgi:tRNA (cmo5U34)-methyltransferase
MLIPENWTFKTPEIANEFDSHVREQLPWYDLATVAVAHLARHYIPEDGVVYDIGASTGNIGRAILPILDDRYATLIPVESSHAMAEKYAGPNPERLIVGDVTTIEIEPYDLGILFLTLMFLPPATRYEWLYDFYENVRPGGAIIVVDKVETARGYIGTALGRLTLHGKIANNVPKDEIIDKELSLAGVQRPINPDYLPGDPVEFFRYGDFAGWIIPRD